MVSLVGVSCGRIDMKLKHLKWMWVGCSQTISKLCLEVSESKMVWVVFGKVVQQHIDETQDNLNKSSPYISMTMSIIFKITAAFVAVFPLSPPQTSMSFDSLVRVRRGCGRNSWRNKRNWSPERRQEVQATLVDKGSRGVASWIKLGNSSAKMTFPWNCAWFLEATNSRIHGIGTFTYIYHRNHPNVGKYTSPMDPMGWRKPSRWCTCWL